MQEIIPNEDVSKPIDTFRITISNVRANLRVAEPRPVVLSFAFDDYWHCQTDVFQQNSVQPRWKFNADTIQGVDPSLSQQQGDDSSANGKPGAQLFHAQRGIVPTVSFVYETESGHMLHSKYLVVTLSERSTFKDVEWGTAVIPLDSIARGCQACDFSIVAKDGVTCYGNVYCNIRMTNIQKLRAHLTDLKLSDYPESYTYDVKLVYLELGLNGFTTGYRNCTEKRSETEPRFSAQPALEWDTTLNDMLRSSSSDSPALKIFFSVHRQVARNRTEEIGVGALPIRMLFAKVTEGWMDLPTKFKVPLANFKGVIRGKVLLRNIPQFSQLPGSDLVNVDGVISPQNVDLNYRKLVPWLKLPNSAEAADKTPKKQGTGIPKKAKHAKFAGTVAKGLENHSQRETSASERHAVAMRKVGKNNGSSQNFHSPITESASEEGSDTSRATSPSRQNNYHVAEPSSGGRRRDSQSRRQQSNLQNQRESSTLYSQRESSSFYTERESSSLYTERESSSLYSQREVPNLQPQRQSAPVPSSTTTPTFPRAPVRHSYEPVAVTRRTEFDTPYGVQEQQPSTTVSELCRKFESGPVSHMEQIRMIGAMRASQEEQEADRWQELPGLEITDKGRPSSTQRQRSDASGSSYHRASVISEDIVDVRDNSAFDFRSRLSKSVGSVGTGDGGVEIGSVVFSEDGYGPGSRTTTEDLLVSSQRLSTAPSSEENIGRMFLGADSGLLVDTNGGYADSPLVSGNIPHSPADEEEEWEAHHDTASLRYYFVSRFTQESLWLPPDWERMEDEYGRQFFVDHGSRNTQRAFPATEARVYRESIYAR